MATVTRTSLMESRQFFENLSRRRRGVLVIDFDSTIARLGRADCVFPYPTVQELLDCITMAGTRVIVATRRPAEELRAHFTAPGPEIWKLINEPELESVGFGSPLAYVTGDSGETTSGRRLRVCPEYRLGRVRERRAPAEDMVQFLMEWLRACTREVC